VKNSRKSLKMEDKSSLFLKTSSIIECKVHPVVIFNILDHFSRRSEDSSRCIGALLGVNNDGVIEIRNSFPVPHTEGVQVGLDLDFQHNMLELHHKVSPKEVIVGWYATGRELNDNSAILHDFYSKEMNRPPIHLTIDTALTNSTLGVRAYVCNNITILEKQMGSQFLPVPVEVQTFDAEKIGLDVLMQGNKMQNSGFMLHDLQTLESSLAKVQQMLDTVSDYVSRVVEQNGPLPEGNIGRFLASTVAALPTIEPSSLEKMFTNSLQDLLLVLYLSNLTKTQLALAEKLQKLV